MYMNNEHEFEYFLNKVKGALMYVGGNFEGKDLTDMTARDFIKTCFTNDVFLDCILRRV